MAKKPRINTGKKRKPMTLAHRKAIGLGLARVLGDTTDYDPYEKKGRKPGKSTGKTGGGASTSKRAKAAERRKNGPKTVESVAAKKLPKNYVSGGGKQASPDFLNKDAIRNEPGYQDFLDMQREMVKSSPEARTAFMNQVKQARKAAQIDHGPDPENGEYGRNRAAQRRALHLEAMAEDMGLIKTENTRRANDQADAINDRAEEAKKRNEQRRKQGMEDRKAARDRAEKQRAEREKRDQEAQRAAKREDQKATAAEREAEREASRRAERDKQEQALERAASDKAAARRAEYANWDDDQLAEAHAAIMDKWDGDLDPANDENYDYSVIGQRERDRKLTADLLDEMDDRAAERAGYSDNRDYNTIAEKSQGHSATELGAAEQEYFDQIAGDRQAETELRDYLDQARQAHAARQAEYKAELDKLTPPEKGDKSDEAKAYRALKRKHDESRRLSNGAKKKHAALETRMRETYPDYDRPFYHTDHEELTDLRDALDSVQDRDADTEKLLAQVQDELRYRHPDELDGWADENIRDMTNLVKKYGHDLTEAQIIDRMAMAGNDRERVMRESVAFQEAYGDWLRDIMAEYAKGWTHEGVVGKDPEGFLRNLMYNNKNDGKNITAEQMLSNPMYARRASGEARELFSSLGFLPSRANFMRTLQGRAPKDYSEDRLREITTQGGKSDRRSKTRILLDDEISAAADARGLRGRARSKFMKEERQRRAQQNIENLRAQDEERRRNQAADTTRATPNAVTTEDGREIDIDTIPGAGKDTDKGLTDRVKAILAAQAARRAESDTPESTAEKTDRENGTTPNAEKAAEAVAKAEANKPAKRGRPKLDGPTLGEQRAEATRAETDRINELKANRPATGDPARAQWEYDMATARLQRAEAVERFERDRMASLAAQNKPITSVKKNIDKAQAAQAQAREDRDNALAKDREKHGDDAAETIRTTGGYVAPAKKKRTPKRETAQELPDGYTRKGRKVYNEKGEPVTPTDNGGWITRTEAAKKMHGAGSKQHRKAAELDRRARQRKFNEEAGKVLAGEESETLNRARDTKRAPEDTTGTKKRDTWANRRANYTEKERAKLAELKDNRPSKKAKNRPQWEQDYAEAKRDLLARQVRFEEERRDGLKGGGKSTKQAEKNLERLTDELKQAEVTAAEKKAKNAHKKWKAYPSFNKPDPGVHPNKAPREWKQWEVDRDEHQLEHAKLHLASEEALEDYTHKRGDERPYNADHARKKLEEVRQRLEKNRRELEELNNAETAPANTGGKPTDAELAESQERVSRAMKAVAGKPADINNIGQYRESLEAMKDHADLLERAGKDATKYRAAIAKVEPQAERIEKERDELNDYLDKTTGDGNNVEKPTLVGYERTGLNSARPIIERPTIPSPEVKRDRTDNTVTFKKLDVPESERIHGVDLSEWTVTGTDLNVGDIVTAKNNRGREQRVTVTQIVSDDNGKQTARFEKTKPEDMPTDETADMSGNNGLQATGATVDDPTKISPAEVNEELANAARRQTEAVQKVGDQNLNEGNIDDFQEAADALRKYGKLLEKAGDKDFAKGYLASADHTQNRIDTMRRALENMADDNDPIRERALTGARSVLDQAEKDVDGKTLNEGTADDFAHLNDARRMYAYALQDVGRADEAADYFKQADKDEPRVTAQRHRDARNNPGEAFEPQPGDVFTYTDHAGVEQGPVVLHGYVKNRGAYITGTPEGSGSSYITPAEYLNAHRANLPTVHQPTEEELRAWENDRDDRERLNAKRAQQAQELSGSNGLQAATPATPATPATGETRDRTDNVVTFRRINKDEWGVTGTDLRVGDIVTARNRKGREKPVTITEIVTDTDGKQVARFEDDKARKRAPKRDAEQTGNNAEKPARTTQAQPATPPTLPEGHDPYTGKPDERLRRAETPEELAKVKEYDEHYENRPNPIKVPQPKRKEWVDRYSELKRELKAMGVDPDRNDRTDQIDAAREAYKPTAAEKRQDSRGLYFNALGAWQTTSYHPNETALPVNEDEQLFTFGKQEVLVPAGGITVQKNGKRVINGTDVKTGKPVKFKSDEFGQFSKPLIIRERPGHSFGRDGKQYTPQNMHAMQDMEQRYPLSDKWTPNTYDDADTMNKIKRTIAEEAIKADPFMDKAPTVTDEQARAWALEKIKGNELKAHHNRQNQGAPARVHDSLMNGEYGNMAIPYNTSADSVLGPDGMYYTGEGTVPRAYRGLSKPGEGLAKLKAALVDDPDVWLTTSVPGEGLKFVRPTKVEEFKYGYRVTAMDENGKTHHVKIDPEDFNATRKIWRPLRHENGDPYTRDEAAEYSSLKYEQDILPDVAQTNWPEGRIWQQKRDPELDAALDELRKRGGELNFDDADEVDGLPDTPAPERGQGDSETTADPFDGWKLTPAPQVSDDDIKEVAQYLANGTIKRKLKQEIERGEKNGWPAGISLEAMFNRGARRNVLVANTADDGTTFARDVDVQAVLKAKTPAGIAAQLRKALPQTDTPAPKPLTQRERRNIERRRTAGVADVAKQGREAGNQQWKKQGNVATSPRGDIRENGDGTYTAIPAVPVINDEQQFNTAREAIDYIDGLPSMDDIATMAAEEAEQAAPSIDDVYRTWPDLKFQTDGNLRLMLEGEDDPELVAAIRAVLAARGGLA